MSDRKVHDLVWLQLPAHMFVDTITEAVNNVDLAGADGFQFLDERVMNAMIAGVR